MTKKEGKRSGGRLSRAEAGRLHDRILDAAAHLFFTEGYGATSIEAIVKRARMSKRTLYSRFDGKPQLFEAVMHRIIQRLRPSETQPIFKGKSIDAILAHVAKLILQASLTPEALALYRTILSEATRFPELAMAVNEQGARREAVHRIGHLLEQEPSLRFSSDMASFAAEQFLQMVVSLPQRRALGLGKPMTTRELDQWAEKTVDLFLHGCKGMREIAR